MSVASAALAPCGTWAKNATFGEPGYRKFGIQLPNGSTIYRVVLVVCSSRAPMQKPSPDLVSA
jgi:hypothetical protein